MLFRVQNPQQTGVSGQYPEYSKYKGVLMKDFYRRCGYCNDSHYYMGGWRGMQIDHFAPRTPFEDLEHEYNNLVYSCFYCNNAKSNDWVTTDAAEPVSPDGRSGYVHPREVVYSDLFKRSVRGGIIPQSDLALYIYTNLNLGLLRHELIYTMERIVDTIKLISKTILENQLDAAAVEILTANQDKLLREKFKLELKFRDIIDAR